MNSSTLVRHSQELALGAYESLARLRLSTSRDGVALTVSDRRRFHRLSPLFTRPLPAGATHLIELRSTTHP